MFTDEKILYDLVLLVAERGIAGVELGDPPVRVQVEWLVGVASHGVCARLQPSARLQNKRQMECYYLFVSVCACGCMRVSVYVLSEQTTNGMLLFVCVCLCVRLHACGRVCTLQQKT